jgi:hypothetical protein
MKIIPSKRRAHWIRYVFIITCVINLYFTFVSTVFLLDFGTVLTVVFFLHSITSCFPDYMVRIRSGEVHSIQQYVITIFSYFQQVGGFLRILRIPPPIKTELHDKTEILLKVALNTITIPPSDSIKKNRHMI